MKAGYEVVAVNPSRHLRYSGMATGVISGSYSPEEDLIDARRLVERGGGRFIEGEVETILSKDRGLLLQDGREVSYDVVSFCLGSVVSGFEGEGAEVIPVKPVENLVEVRRRMLDSGGGLRVLVVGGGAAGCEVAANAATLVAGGGVALVEAGPALLGVAPGKASREMRSCLEERGVEVVVGSPVASCSNGEAVLADGRRMEADLFVAATGVAPPPVFRKSGLSVGKDGGLLVDRSLRSVDDGRILGGGDCIAFPGEPLERLGVHAVRQGPVLLHNLRATLEGGPLAEYRPRKRHLCVLNLGDGTGLAVYGPFAWRGRLAMKLKDHLDRSFMRKHGPE